MSEELLREETGQAKPPPGGVVDSVICRYGGKKSVVADAVIVGGRLPKHRYAVNVPFPFASSWNGHHWYGPNMKQPAVETGQKPLESAGFETVKKPMSPAGGRGKCAEN